MDVDAFEGAAKRARLSRETAGYRAAVDLYTGDLLSGDRYEQWAQARREELRQKYLWLLVELAALHEERDEYVLAIEALRRATADPGGVAQPPVAERRHKIYHDHTQGELQQRRRSPLGGCSPAHPHSGTG